MSYDDAAACGRARASKASILYDVADWSPVPVLHPSFDKASNPKIGRRQWLARAGVLAGSSLLIARGSAQHKLLPLETSGLDHLSITVPDSVQAAAFYGRIFDPQVFHERTGVQRYYVRLGAAYIAFGPQANATPYIDHIAAGVVDFVEADFGKPEMKAQVEAAGLAAPAGGLPMLSDPDKLRLQLVNATHGLFDTLMPGGRVTTAPAALIPIGLDHIMVSVTDAHQSAAHYRKLFGPEESHERNPLRIWFKLADTRLGLEAAPSGQKPGFSHFCVKVAGFDRAAATSRLQKLGLKVEAGSEKGTLRFRDLHNLPVEVISGRSQYQRS
jgi:catechol 2,3-dioxygenase-like lactoylglutathione lyase family enzyme